MAHTPPERHRRMYRRALLVAASIVAVALVVAVPFTFVPKPRVGSDGSIDGPPPLIVFIGDSFAERLELDTGGTTHYPYLIAKELGTRWITITAKGAGYSSPGVYFQRFDGLVRQIPVDADVVVIVGSDDDTRFAYKTIRFAAETTFATVEETAPDAQLLVVGTPWMGDSAPRSILTTRDAVRDAADAVGALFVDPIAEGWWATGGEAEVSNEGLRPTEVGDAKLALRIEPLVRDLLTQQRLED
jgi:hypothetical protein